MAISLQTVRSGFSLLFTCDARRVYEFVGTPPGKRYLNLGYWAKENMKWEEASDELVRSLGRLGNLRPADRILDVGFGFGEQDLLWNREFGCRDLLGINLAPLHVSGAAGLIEQQGLMESIHYQFGDATAIPFQAAVFDKVVALECAFHFKTREEFFREAYRVLKPAGILVTADIVRGARKRPPPWHHRILRFLHERFWQIPKQNRYDAVQYHQRLQQAGFHHVSVNDISDKVFDPLVINHLIPLSATQNSLTRFFLRQVGEFCRSGFLRYVFAKARKPGQELAV